MNKNLLQACKALLEMSGGPDGLNYGGSLDPKTVREMAVKAIAEAESTPQTPGKFYLVLSVKEIKALAKAAKDSQKVTMGASDAHCVVLYLNETSTRTVTEAGESQLCSYSFEKAVERIRSYAANRKSNS